MANISGPGFLPTPPSILPSTSTPSGSPNSGAPAGQVIPSTSFTSVISSALSEVASESIDETQEEMSMALGGRMADGRRIGTRTDPRRNLAMLQQLLAKGDDVEDVEVVIPVQLAQLLERFADIHERPDPFAFLRQSGMDAGQMAFLLAAMLTNKGLSAQSRRRLEEAFYQATEDETWALSLFAQFELGATTPAAFGQLKRLYQRAGNKHHSLVGWFGQFRSMKDRQRKLKILIRALAFELSAQRPELRDTHLAAIIMDLKRIIQFLGLSDHCEEIAESLAIPGIDRDRIMMEALEILDQSWIFSGWLAQRNEMLNLPLKAIYPFTRQMADLAKLLPEQCYRDTEQQEMLQTAYSEYLNILADNEG
ncbi:MAG: TyeA family type III secretion system gatekeeper subunit [Ottowia sp.]|nr:TyeA family type III secretion system gatekeeper subunit [Ottowia sp.]